MKRLPLLKLALGILACVGVAHAQSQNCVNLIPSASPNIGLYVIPTNACNWGNYLNDNMGFIDSYLSGNLGVPRLWFPTTTTPSNPPNGLKIWVDASDGLLHTINSAGVNSVLGSGSGPGGGVSAFAAPPASWPSWLVPTVTNPNTTPTLTISASVIPNSALANPSLNINGTVCTLGVACNPSSGGGAVPSVFGRTGAIVASNGDYNVGQVTGAAPLASPSFTGTVSIVNQILSGSLTLSSLANGCMQIASNIVTSTGSACGSGGSGGTPGGTNGQIQFNNAGAFGGLPTTGSGGVVVLSTSPTLVTPNLGVPSFLNLTNATGYPVATTGTFGVVRPDNSTITIAAGVLTAVGGGGGGSSFQGAGALSGRPTAGTPGVGVYQYLATDNPINQQLYTVTSSGAWTQGPINLTGGNLLLTGGALGTNPATSPTLASANPWTAVNTFQAGIVSGVVFGANSTVTFSAQSGAGTGAGTPTCTNNNCDSFSGTLTMVMGTSTAAGNVLNIGFGTHVKPPNCVVNYEASATNTAQPIRKTVTTTTLTYTAAVAPTASESYTFTYICNGN